MKSLKKLALSALFIMGALPIMAQTMTFVGTLTVDKSAGALSVENVEYKITPKPDGTAEFVTTGMKFGPKMPSGLTIVFDGIKYSKDGDNYAFEIDMVRPTADGKPYGSASLRNFMGTIEGTSLTIGFETGRDAFCQYYAEKKK